MEDVDLEIVKRLLRVAWEETERTVSELLVFGTATSSSSIVSSSEEVVDVGRVHCAKEQKFIVFTLSIWRSHGCFLGSGGVSTGSTTLMEPSSSSESFHTIS